jgi:nitrite reductase (NO-forming)
MKNLQHPLFPFFVLVVLLLAVGVSGCRTRPLTAQTADVVFTLQTGLMDGRMAFVGVGGAIEGVANPDLIAHAGETVRLVIINGDGMPHDLAIPDLHGHTPLLTGREQDAELTFQAGEPGVYVYYCTVSGHRQIGMEGRLIVTADERP